MAPLNVVVEPSRSPLPPIFPSASTPLPPVFPYFPRIFPVFSLSFPALFLAFPRRLEEVAKAVGGGYCRLQMPLKLAFAVRGTVAGHRLGALEEGGWAPPPLPMHPCPRPSPS